MKIGIQATALQTSQDFRKAGIARYAYCITDALIKSSEHEFHLFVTPELDLPSDWISRPNVKIHRRWKKQRTWNYLVGGIGARLLGLDVWFSLAHTIPPVGFVKRAIFVHDLFPFRYPEYFADEDLAFYKENSEFACKNAEIVLANSEATRKEIHDVFDIDVSEVIVTPLGPGNDVVPREPESVSDTELRETGVNFTRFFFTLSTLEPRKNLPALIEAIAVLRKEEEFRDVGLVVGGGKGWKDEAIFARVQELGLAESVCFLGYVPDQNLPPIFARCTAFVCASLDEGFGIPVLEALMLGAPVISSNRGALPEVGGDVARYFDPSEPQAIAAALKAFLVDNIDRAALRLRGFEQASNFSWEKAAQQTLKAFEEASKR